MRLSPSFDNNLPDFSPRPSIPLETISLGTLKYSPPKLVVKSETKPKETLLIHQQPVDTTAFFKPSAQPKASLPTLVQPKIKIVPHVEVKKIVPIQIPIKQVIPVHPPPHPIAQPVPQAPPPPAPKPPAEKPNLIALKKVIQSVAKPQHPPIKFTPPPKKPHIDTEPEPQPHIPAPTIEPKSELKKLNVQLNEILNTPTPKIEEKPIQKSVPIHEPDIQDLISKELAKVIPPSPKPVPVREPLPQVHPFQKPASPQLNPPAKNIPNIPAAPAKQQLSRPEPLIFSPGHFWDLFLIRVNPKLNPYKSVIRTRIILGIKISGLVLLALGVFIVFSGFFTGISLNIIFEAISTLAISGILLFLGEHLNLFFEPINPYQVHEVV